MARRRARQSRTHLVSASASSSDIVVRVQELYKRFVVRRPWAEAARRPFARRQVTVLSGVTLQVRRGEFFGLLGPNGAGKTTLFKILSTVVLPDRGTVDVAGEDVVRAPHRVRQVLTPVVADERSLYWRLTGAENLRLFAALYGLRAPDANRRAGELLDVVGISHAADRMVNTYSSGMRQRLLIARALLSRPSVLLLDEPTRSLDPIGARDFRRFLREDVAGRQGCTVLLATHDTDEALELCDRLAVLDRGRIVATGTARELAEQTGARRYRAVVAAEDGERARCALNDFGWRNCSGSPSVDGDGWTTFEGDTSGTAADAADVVRRLIALGVTVAEFARVSPSLADLIERLVAASPGHTS